MAVPNAPIDMAAMLALSPREQAVVELAIKGQHAPQIALNLGLSDGAVRAIFATPMVQQAIHDLRAASAAQTLAGHIHLAIQARKAIEEMLLPINPMGIRAKGVELAIKAGVFGDVAQKTEVNVTNVTAVQQNSVKLEITAGDLERLSADELDRLIARARGEQPIDAEIVEP